MLSYSSYKRIYCKPNRVLILFLTFVVVFAVVVVVDDDDDVVFVSQISLCLHPMITITAYCVFVATKL